MTCTECRNMYDCCDHCWGTGIEPPPPIPRRCYINKLIPAETAIREALIAVEALGAHPKLTEVVSMLADAQRKIADWHDGGRPGGNPE